MDFKYQFNKIQTDDSLMETVQHGNMEYPFSYYYDDMSMYDFHCIDWHWHEEIEFVYIELGNVSLDVGNHHFELSEGTGVMVNSKILHRMESEEAAIVPNFLFHPTFIVPKDSLIYEKSVLPILNSSLSYIIFSPENRWQKDVLALMRKIIAIQENEINQEILVSMLVQQIWILLLENQNFAFEEDKMTVSSRTRLQLMMRFIHTHYAENITLEDIAESADISKSSALHLFQDNLKITPVNYLIHVRLKQAAYLLVNTEKRIQTISSEIGFNNVDHFCRSFKKVYQITPTSYRRQK